MKSTRKGKRLLSGALALVMCASMLTEPAAAIAQQGSEPIRLEASRLDREEMPEGQLLYFGTASVTLEEENQSYAVPVYREGDLSGEVSVELRTIDLSATYGKDYEMVMSGVSKNGGDGTILERYMEAALAAEESLEEEEASVEEEQPAEDEAPAEEEQSDEDEAPAEDELPIQAQTAPSGSSLAQLKEDATGEETRETEESEIQSLADSLIQSMIPDMMDQLDYSSSTTLTFAPGEDEKWVVFRLKDDHKSEGTETFSLMLTDPVGAETYKVTSLSVTIKDDEPVVHSTVSFTKARYDSENGVATVVVKRTGAEYSLVDMRIYTSRDTAEADVNYEAMDATLTFMPYETEKEVEFYVAGSGCFSVLIDDFTACQAGRITKTKVYIAEGENGVSLQASSRSSSFNITINGYSYEVQYNTGDAWGKIVDTNLKPAVEVGRYYFALPNSQKGLFNYSTSQMTGNKPNRLGTLDCEYVNKSTQHESYGDIAYLHTTAGKKGTVYTTTQNTPIPGLYYQYMVPDWESTSDYGINGQKFKFRIETPGKDAYAEGKFSRTQSSAYITMKNYKGFPISFNKWTNLQLASIDDSGWTPKSYMRFYGVAAMYKCYNVEINNPYSLEFRTGTLDKSGKAVTSLYTPFQANVKCGAQSAIAGVSGMNIYVNPENTDTDMVFTLTSSKVGSQTGIFGTVSGYAIQIVGNGKNMVTLNYPQDFISFMQEKSANRGQNQNDMLTRGQKDVADYSSSAVAAEIKRVEGDLESVPFDAYFVDWIDSQQTSVIDSGYGYYQKLIFTPKADHKEVKVSVLAPAGERQGSFTAYELSSIGEKVFNLGDVLDLRAESYEEQYIVDGYQYTESGNSWNTYTENTLLTLSNEKGYSIRPNLTPKGNHIEIEFVNNAQNYITVLGADQQGTVAVGKLNSKVDLTGKTVLNLNPNGADASEKIDPTVGEIYSIFFVGKKVNGITYRPVITDTMTGKVYKTNLLHFTARNEMEDNILRVSYEAVRDNEWVEFTLNGQLMSNYLSIRASAEATKHLGIRGYTVTMAKEQGVDKYGNPQVESASSTSASDGTYILSGVQGKTGDRVTMLLSNGSDKQVQEVVLGGTVSARKANMAVATQYLDYPANAPSVRKDGVTYQYTKTNLNSGDYDNRDNSMRILDGELKITAILQKYEEVSKVIFTVYNAQGNLVEKYDSSIDTDVSKNHVEFKDGTAVLDLVTPMETMHNGYRITITLVSTKHVEGVDYDTTYPEVDTGLVGYIMNEQLVPLTYDIDDQNAAIDIPILGATSASASTGLLNLGRTNWTNGKGYTVSVNLDALLYSTVSPSTSDKVEKARALYAAAETVEENLNAVDSLGKSIDDTMMSVMQKVQNGELSEKSGDSQIGKLEHQKETFKQYESVMKKNAKEPVANFNKAFSLRADVLFVMSFDFIYDEANNEYVFCCGAVAAGITANFNKSIYTSFYGMPVFLNFGGSIQVDTVVSYQTEEGEDLLTAGAFEGVEGNIADRLSDTRAIIDIIVSAKAQIGAGMCGVTSIRGGLTYTMQFAIPVDDDEDDHNMDGWGVFINLKGSIGMDMLIASLDFDYGDIVLGYGVYEKMDKISFFEDAIELTSVRGASSGNNSTGESVAMQEYSSGSADFSQFGGSGLLRGMPEAVSLNVLQENAADRTRPRLVELDDGRRMIFFIGSRGSGSTLNDRALYYSVCGADGKWSTPVMVADDGTVDASPTVLQKNGKVVVAWVDAQRAYTADDTNVDKLNAMNISMAIYENGTMSGEIQLTRDEFFNFAPQLELVGDTLYCSYMKRDLSKVEEDEDLADFTNHYSTMAYVACDVQSRTLLPYEDAGGQERTEHYITVQHPTITDPLVMDYQSVATKVGSTNYMLATYTVDEDGVLSTSGDRELFLAIEDLDSGKSYYPIALTSDQLNQAEPKLTVLNGTVYLSWLEEGSRFCLLNISEMMQALFAPGDIGATNEEGTAPLDLSRVAAAYLDSVERGDENWYRKSAEDLGLSEVIYERSIYDQLRTSELRVEQVNFQEDEESALSIGDYVLTTNGTDIYIFYTSPTTDENNLGMELFGARYLSESSGADDDDCAHGFGKSVQITDYGMVIDEFDLVMTTDNKISVVSNYYDQWIEGGKTLAGPNQLVEIDFQPKGSLEVRNDAIDLPFQLTSGATEDITFTVENQGLLTATGFDLKVYEKTSAGEKEIYSGSVEQHLDAGEGCEVTIPWKIPDSVEGMSIRVVVNEKNVSIANAAIVEKKVPYAAKLTYSDVETVWDGEQAVMTAAVTNTGNKAAEATTGTLSLIENGKAVKTLAEIAVPALASGESVELTVPFQPAVGDFQHLGYMDVQLEAHGYTASSRFVPGAAVCAEINEGAERLSVKRGGTAKVSTQADPWDALAGGVVYTTDDPSVATVDSDGTVYGVSTGTTTLRATYGELGITDTITVAVGSSSGSSSEKDTATVITVPVSSDRGTVHVDAAVSRGNATVEVTDKELETVIADGAGSVTLDVSGLKNVDSAVVPGHVVEKTNEAEDTGLTVALPAGSVELDETALASIARAANGKDVTVSVTSVSASVLPQSVKDIIGMDAAVAAVVDVNILVDGKKLSGFNGGKVTISVPYVPKVGEDTGKLTVWYIRDDGTVENMGGYYDGDKRCFVFETDHLSRYVLGNTNAKQSFTDVSSDAYYASAVSWAAEQGVTGGVGGGQFGPDLSCTRAQIVTFLWRAAGSPEAKHTSAFVDVPEDAYYAKAVAWAVENGITDGIGDGRFGPDLTCTRAQAATFLYRNEQAKGGGFTGTWMFRLPFTDVPEWCYEAVAWCYKEGITSGVSATAFGPDSNCTRAQIVTFLYKANNK